MWAAPSRELEPSLYHTLRVLSKYDRHPCFDMDLYIDIHAHSTSKSGFLFCNPVPEDKAQMLERSVRLPKLLDSHMVGFSLNACRWDADPGKAGCARRVAGSSCPNTMCYTLEASFFHVPDPSAPRKDDTLAANASAFGSTNAGGARGAPANNDRAWPWPNTEDGFLTMGRQLAVALFDFYNLKKPGNEGGNRSRVGVAGRASARIHR